MDDLQDKLNIINDYAESLIKKVRKNSNNKVCVKLNLAKLRAMDKVIRILFDNKYKLKYYNENGIIWDKYKKRNNI